MENQHRHIRGYRELSMDEIADMNEVKKLAAAVGDLTLRMREKYIGMGVGTVEQAAEQAEALRWLTTGEMQSQQAFMAITRSIARPTTF